MWLEETLGDTDIVAIATDLAFYCTEGSQVNDFRELDVFVNLVKIETVLGIERNKAYHLS